MKSVTLKSPDQKLGCFIEIKDSAKDKQCLYYRIAYKGTDIILDSSLGLVLKGSLPLNCNFEIVNVTSSSHNDNWEPVFGERSVIPDHYTEAEIELMETEGLGRRFCLNFRAYNEGVAFRYVLPEQENLREFTIVEEMSEFHFPRGCMAYQEHGAEGEYSKVLIEEVGDNCERPLTVEYPDGTYVCLAEAAMDCYSRMLLSRKKENPQILVSALSGYVAGFTGYPARMPQYPHRLLTGEVTASAPFMTPWRLLLIGERPGELLEHNYILLNLNPPCELQDTSWVRPGKAIRAMNLSTKGGKEYVDFAVRHRLQYVLFDGGWYGDPYNDASDATALPVKVWEKRVSDLPEYQGLDIVEVIDYANCQGIGVWLYLDRRALESQLDRALPLYKSWGVKGIKFGFVNTGPQEWTKWLHGAVKKCAQYGLMVNVHDAYRPTGFSRIYPNLITQEGIRGNEHMPTASHNATLPFTRFIAGAGDYTICYYSDRLKTTHAHQLAMSIICYSPLQCLFWYDAPEDWQGEPEIELFEHLPVVWEETRVLHDKIGEYAAIARRKGEEWYVGCITNEQARTLELSLSFLEPEKEYRAYVYSDGLQNNASRTGVAISERAVCWSTPIRVIMASSGGTAIRILPERPLGTCYTDK